MPSGGHKKLVNEHKCRHAAASGQRGKCAGGKVRSSALGKAHGNRGVDLQGMYLISHLSVVLCKRAVPCFFLRQEKCQAVIVSLLHRQFLLEVLDLVLKRRLHETGFSLPVADLSLHQRDLVVLYQKLFPQSANVVCVLGRRVRLGLVRLPHFDFHGLLVRLERFHLHLYMAK
eukprot:6202745-Pleurochrysis_carterae.AAC.3